MSRPLLVLAILPALTGCTTIRPAYERLASEEAVPAWDGGDPPGTPGPNDIGQSGGNADRGEQ
ncbi:MAG TPA: hypothetical protein VFL90_07255 [Methylomirabilota bacterium]|nr:hypothetical protein [Methylomirabilota bacterium]